MAVHDDQRDRQVDGRANGHGRQLAGEDLAEALQRQGTYEPAGGLQYLSELSLATPSASHIEHYAHIVLEHAVRRRYIGAAQQVAELAWDRRRGLGTVKQRAEALGLGASSDTLSRRAGLP